MPIDHIDALPPGTRLEEYRLDTVLGAGGFGITYRAYDAHLDKFVAIKEYLPGEFAARTQASTVVPKSDTDAQDYHWGLNRFLDEARTLARFDHPHLNRVYRFFESNGTAYMVLEYVQGETLAGRLSREARLQETVLRRLLEEVLSGLAVVHEAGYVHRDIKPGNLMLREENGSVVVLDFGAARQAVGQRSRPMTSILTPGYAPIEQYDSKAEDVGPWSDIYALGMVAYRCVSGAGDNELPDAVTRSRLQRKGQDDLMPATQAGKGRYQPKLLEAIGWAMEVEEGERPQSVAEWQRGLAGERARKRASRTGGKQIPGQTTGAPRRAGMRWLEVVFTLVMAALLGVGAWWGWQVNPEWFGQGEDAPVLVGRQESPAEIPEAISPRVEAEKTEEALARSGQETEQSRMESAGEVAQKSRQYAGEMISIPAGNFRMGDLSGKFFSRESPVHIVTVPAFRLGKHEVKFAQWDACVADGGCNGYSPDDRGFGRGDWPVIDVSWDDVQSFIDWLNEKTGGNYRLPTEAEWEYAARAGTATKYSWGNDIGSNRANCDDNCGDSWDFTAPIGSFPANPWGLHDMHGNVWEWVQDCWNDDYDGAPTDSSAWKSGDCELRVVRGGSWDSRPIDLRSSYRGKSGSAWGGAGAFGFRLAQDDKTGVREPVHADEMISIPAGSFDMGDLSGEGNDYYERPIHRVTLQAFRLGKYEVTVGQFRAFVEATAYRAVGPGSSCRARHPDGNWDWISGNIWREPGFTVADDQPVVCVSWDDTQSFIDWLNERTGGNYRLPTEAEWEYAARAGTATKYSWGNDIGSNRSNCANQALDSDYRDCGDFWEYTAPIGSFSANPWGLHDMHGNVMEWVQDCWNGDYGGAPTDGSAWMSGYCHRRVVRGGSWSSLPGGLRSAYRFWSDRSNRHSKRGFRLAQDE